MEQCLNVGDNLRNGRRNNNPYSLLPWLTGVMGNNICAASLHV